MLNDNGDIDLVSVMGLLIGFLVVGVIGTYVGDQMIQVANQTPLQGADAQSIQTVIQTFGLCVTLCKIIVIVSIAAVIFVLLGHTGLIPSGGSSRSGYSSGYSGRSSSQSTPISRPQPPVQQPTRSPVQAPVNTTPAPAPTPEPIHNTNNRWETLEVVIPSDNDDKSF